MSLFLVIFMYGAWSSVFSLGKLALEKSPPIFFTGVRMVFGAAVLLGILLIKSRSALKMGKEHFLPLAALSIFSIYLTNILEFWGLQHLTAAKTCFIYSLSPFLSALFSYLHFGERVTIKKLLGMLIGLCGFVPILFVKTGEESFFHAFSVFSWPELAIMGAALFSVYGWVLLRMLVKSHDLSPLHANGYSMLFGGVLALIHSGWVDSWSPLPIAKGDGTSFIQGVAAITLISNVLCYNLYGYLLKKYTATFLSFVGLLSPIFASLSSWILLGESPSWQILASTGVVSVGLFLVYQAELRQGYILRVKSAVTKT